MSEKRVQKILKDNLGLNQNNIEIEQAHQVGKLVESWQKKKLKGTRIDINEDYFDPVKRKRKESMPELRAAWNRGDAAILRYDELIIKQNRRLNHAW